MWSADLDSEQGECPQCGHPREECSDPGHDWFPQRTVCYATMQREAARRTYEDLHKDRPFHDGAFTSWAAEFSDAHPFHYLDGVNVWAAGRDLAPDDDFLKRKPRED